MYLTKEEERILNGELGEAKALALKIIVKVGEALGAEKLIDISHAHISGISYFSIKDYGLNLLEDLRSKGARFTVYTTANPYASVTTDFLGKRLPMDIVNKQNKIVSILRVMGASTFTCTPYYVRKPRINEHLAWAESNAVLYANSVLGAKTNREGGPTALMSAIIGKTYYWGVHDDEYIEPCLEVLTYTPNTTVEASAVGYILGKKCPHCIPLIKGLKLKNEAQLKSFLAAFGTTSSAAMVIIDGLTPLSKKVKERINKLRGNIERDHIDKNEVKKLINENKFKKIEGRGLYLIGCPHISSYEIKEVINTLLSVLTINRSLVRRKELWLVSWKPPLFMNVIKEKLSKFNIKILHGICPVVTKLNILGVDYVVTDSFKALHYIKSISGVDVFIDDRKNILRRFIYE